VETVDRTYMWTHSEEECPWNLVQQYRVTIKIQTTSLWGSLELMEDKLKEQVAGLELGTMWQLCVAHSHLPTKFPKVPVGADITRLETLMSFLQIRSSMRLHEKI
jgi:hypothetical protein